MKEQFRALAKLMLALPTSILAADGDIDTSFGTDGVAELASAFDCPRLELESLALAPDERIIAVGDCDRRTTPGRDSDLGIFRLNSDGQLDTTFGVNGVATVDYAVPVTGARDVVIAPDGSIFVTGSASGSVGVFKLTPDGQLDTSFSDDGVYIDPIAVRGTRLVLQSDGKLLVGTPNAPVIRLLPNGERDLSFGGDGVVILRLGGAYGLAIDRIGGIIAVGGNLGFTVVEQDLKVERLQPNGSYDFGFGGTADGVVRVPVGTDGKFESTDVAIDVLGRIYVTGIGNSTLADDKGVLVRLLSDGSLDSSFGASGISAIGIPDLTILAKTLTIRPDGKILLAGAGTPSGVLGPFFEFIIMSFLPDGTLDSQFGIGGWQQVDASADGRRILSFSENRHGLIIDPKGRIVSAHQDWVVAVDAPDWDLTPSELDFGSNTNVPLSTLQVSQLLTLQGGLDPGVAVPYIVENGLVGNPSTGFGNLTALGGLSTNGTQLVLSHTSAPTSGATVTTSLIAGGVRAKNNQALIVGTLTVSQFSSTTSGSPSLYVSYNNAAEFSGAVLQGGQLIDFEDFTPPGGFLFFGDPGSFTDKGVTFTSNSPMFLQNNNLYGTGAFLSPQQANPEIVDILLPSGTRALAFSYQSNAAEVSLADGTIFDIPAVGFGSLGFFGLVSDQPIASVRIEIAGPGIDLDNVLFATDLTMPVVDSDDDGIADRIDNCSATENPEQIDTDGDLYGNACDADLDGNGIVNFGDLALFKAAFGTDDADADLDGNGVVNFADLAGFKSLFGKPPGPSSLAP